MDQNQPISLALLDAHPVHSRGDLVTSVPGPVESLNQDPQAESQPSGVREFIGGVLARVNAVFDRIDAFIEFPLDQMMNQVYAFEEAVAQYQRRLEFESTVRAVAGDRYDASRVNDAVLPGVFGRLTSGAYSVDEFLADRVGQVTTYKNGSRLVEDGSSKVVQFHDQMYAASGSQEDVDLMLRLAESLGWTRIELTGPGEFKERAMLTAVERGFGVYAHDPDDRWLLASIQSEVGARNEARELADQIIAQYEVLEDPSRPRQVRTDERERERNVDHAMRSTGITGPDLHRLRDVLKERVQSYEPLQSSVSPDATHGNHGRPTYSIAATKALIAVTNWDKLTGGTPEERLATQAAVNRTLTAVYESSRVAPEQTVQVVQQIADRNGELYPEVVYQLRSAVADGLLDVYSNSMDQSQTTELTGQPPSYNLEDYAEYDSFAGGHAKDGTYIYDNELLNEDYRSRLSSPAVSTATRARSQTTEAERSQRRIEMLENFSVPDPRFDGVDNIALSTQISDEAETVRSEGELNRAVVRDAVAGDRRDRGNDDSLISDLPVITPEPWNTVIDRDGLKPALGQTIRDQTVRIVGRLDDDVALGREGTAYVKIHVASFETPPKLQDVVTLHRGQDGVDVATPVTRQRDMGLER